MEARLMTIVLVVATLICVCIGCRKAEIVSASQQPEPRSTSAADKTLVRDDGKASRSYVVKGFNLKLDGRSGTCVLSYTKGTDEAELTLRIPSPCRFVGSNEKPLMYSYDENRQVKNRSDEASMTVLLIASSRPHGDRDTNPSRKNDCDTKAQAVMVRESGVTTSEDVHSELSCGTEFFDEKVFSILSHPNGG